MAKPIFGTGRFVSKSHAVRYYRDQDNTLTLRDAHAMVIEKLKWNEIYIGEPKIQNTQGARVVLLDKGCRYGVEVDF